MCSGAKIYLIGTAHFSKESCEDVSRIIQATQPDIVMVELCKQEPEIFLFIQLYPTWFRKIPFQRFVWSKKNEIPMFFKFENRLF